MAQKSTTLKTKKDKTSYSLGVVIGKDVARNINGADINKTLFVQGLKDAINNSKYALTENEMKTILESFQQEMIGKMQAKSEKNKKEGEAFLAANKQKEGVVTLPSGLQYKILKAGDGAKPTAAQTVKCNYRGTLLDGTEFDSSYKRGEPTEFPIGQVIKGWVEALQLMPVGSKWQLFIPSNLAYGENGGGPGGPNATLIFEIELISIK